jgi:3-dehydrotetronate 4-kinase
MKLGVIADDFTGAVDIAGFLDLNGLSTILCNGVPVDPLPTQTGALVVSLKIRSCPPKQAVAQALDALAFLLQCGCTHFYYKYCSTFDSTHEGNIGPVVDALMSALQVKTTIICPALPVNKRTVYQGYLFVGENLLQDSSMKDHPITPMHDSKLARLMQGQCSGTTTHIFHQDVVQGAKHIAGLIAEAEAAGASYVVTDILTDVDLRQLAFAVLPMRLVTGGSGLAPALAQEYNARGFGRPIAASLATPTRNKGVVLAGSCSQMTNQQVSRYLEKAAGLSLDIARCLYNPAYVDETVRWVLDHLQDTYAPLVYSTRTPAGLAEIKARYPDMDVAQRIEGFFADIAMRLAQNEVRNFIIAGGETSGVVVQALRVSAFYIGPQIDPGVSWVRSVGGDFNLALKSGNFGLVDFFCHAQDML